MVYFRSHLSSDAKQTQQPLKGLNIVIDAGHGGQDIGSDSLLGNQSTDEEQLNLLMALRTVRPSLYFGRQRFSHPLRA